MNEREEELLEALNRAYRLKEQAEEQHRESQLLLTGTRALLEANSSEDMYKRMFEVFSNIIPYEIAFVLDQQAPGTMICTSSTFSPLQGSTWKLDSVFKRAVLGQPCAVYDIQRQPAWIEHLPGLNQPMVAALYCPFSGPGINAILVFCHSEKGFYINRHTQMAVKYKEFMEQTLLSVNAKLLALESQSLRAEKERVEQGLVQSEKMASLGLLAAGVAHEINNPIGFVSSNINYLADSLKDIKELDQNLNALVAAHQSDRNDQIQQALQAAIEWQQDSHIDETLTDLDDLVKDCRDGLLRVRDIVSGLRNFARVDDESTNPVDINRCIESTLKLVANEIKYHCEVETELGPTEAIMGNEGKLNQVLTNLLVNAGHAIEEKGKIRIASSTCNHPDLGHCTWFSVRDNGCGISPEKLSRIFEPFYTTKEVGKGTGLGLAISYSIIENMGGIIEVESQLNKGTCFSVFIPVSDF